MLGRLVGELTEEQRTQLGIINRSGRQLLGLISDVLDISKIETGQLTLQLEPLVLNELLREQQRVFELQAQHRELGLRFEVPDEPIQVIADAQRLRQVIGNLLTNAVKFTDRGEVGLSVAIHGAFVRITIFDSGIGIATADQPKLFKAFQRLKPALGGTRDGTGLGLAISRRLVEGDGRTNWRGQRTRARQPFLVHRTAGDIGCRACRCVGWHGRAERRLESHHSAYVAGVSVSNR